MHRGQGHTFLTLKHLWLKTIWDTDKLRIRETLRLFTQIQKKNPFLTTQIIKSDKMVDLIINVGVETNSIVAQQRQRKGCFGLVYTQKFLIKQVEGCYTGQLSEEGLSKRC